MRIGVVMPTLMDKARLKLIQYALDQMDKQTLQPHAIEVVSYPSKGLDITERYKKGFNKLAKDTDIVFAWEDDDWYSADYLQIMVNEWVNAGKPTLIGVAQTLYYNIIERKYAYWNHIGRSSMFCTGIKSSDVHKIDWGSNKDLYLDAHLWKKHEGVAVGFNKYIAVGIKHGLGLCASNGHQKNWNMWRGQDPECELLGNVIDKESLNFYKTL